MSGTPKQFLLLVCSAIHACKQMGLDTSFAKATALESATLDVELMKGEYVQQLCNSKKNKCKGNKGGESDSTPSAVAMAKANYKSAAKALEAAKLTLTMAGAKAFKLSGNLLLDEARQSWEKINKGDSCTVGRHIQRNPHRASY